MPNILHRVGIDASLAKVFEALITIEGLQHWWVGETGGNTNPGDLINFGFCKMNVIESIPDTLVHWKCVSGADEWIDTEVFFG